MSFFGHKHPWYVAGLAFECVECGHCCAGPEEGYVWVTDDEVPAIARHLGMNEGEFRGQYVRKVGRRYSLREVKGSKDCVFLTERAGAGRGGACARQHRLINLDTGHSLAALRQRQREVTEPAKQVKYAFAGLQVQ